MPLGILMLLAYVWYITILGGTLWTEYPILCIFAYFGLGLSSNDFNSLISAALSVLIII